MIRPQLTGRMLSEAVEIYAPQFRAEIEKLSQEVGRNDIDDRETAYFEKLAAKKAEEQAKAEAAAAAAAETQLQAKRMALTKIQSKEPVDTASKLTPKQQKKKDEEDRKAGNTQLPPQRVQRLHPSRYPPEVSAFFRLLSVYLALDRGLEQRGLELLRSLLADIYAQAEPGREPLAARRSFDTIAARARMLQATATERVGAAQNIDTLTALREEFLVAFAAAVRALHEQTQASLWTCIARSFVLQRRYEQAHSFVTQAPFPKLDRVPAAVCARHLYYTGFVACTQLRYADAVDALLHAYRKAPTNGSVGFNQALVKALVCAQLAVGTIPARTLFAQPRVAAGLGPYLQLTNCVRRGDVRGFSRLMADTTAVNFFRADGLLSVVQRLKESVLRAGLRRIVQCYAQIPLAAVADRLALDELLDAETIVLKGIHDGVIDARLDLVTKVLTATRKSSITTCQVPQEAVLKRIGYCLELRDQVATNMRFPAPNYNELNV